MLLKRHTNFYQRNHLQIPKQFSITPLATYGLKDEEEQLKQQSKENSMSVSLVRSNEPSPMPSLLPSLEGFREMASNDFFETFSDAKQIWTGELTGSKEISVSSVEMSDCITIFGIIYTSDNRIEGINGYHCPSGMSKEGLSDEYFEWMSKDDKVSLVLIGGNDASTQKGDLLTTIYETIEEYFGTTDCIKHQLVGINADGLYTTVNVQMDGTLTYCRH